MLKKCEDIYVLDGQVLLEGLSYVQSFGKALTHFRKKRNVKQKELIPILGIEAPAISKLELGNSCPNVVQLRLLCSFYQCTPQEVYDLAEQIFLASTSIKQS